MSNPPEHPSVPFPHPYFERCVLRNLPVLTSPGIVSNLVVLVCKGLYWELGPEIKVTIYGNIVRAIRLNQASGGHLTRSNDLAAIKIYDKNRVQRDIRRRVENPYMEISAMKLISEHNLSMKLLILACEDADNLYVIMKYCPGGDLCDYVMDELGEFAQFNEQFARHVFAQIVHGAGEIHALGWAHKDLSLENVLYDPDTSIATIIDFGMAMRHQLFVPGAPPVTGAGAGTEAVYCPTTPGEPKCGKALYIAPEMQHTPLPGLDFRRCDVWSLGIMLFILLTGVPPMEMSTTADERFRRIAQQGTLAQLLQEWGFPLSQPCVHLLQSMLREVPEQRPTAAQILAHPWMRTALLPAHMPHAPVMRARAGDYWEPAQPPHPPQHPQVPQEPSGAPQG